MFGTLLSLIRAQKSSKKPTIYIFKNVYYIYQGITAGVSYLHQNGMVHGDIKGIKVLCVLSYIVCSCNTDLRNLRVPGAYKAAGTTDPKFSISRNSKWDWEISA